MFRVANERLSHVVEAQLRVTLLRDELTKEGEYIRKIHDLSLVRSQSPAFALSWTVLHPIGPSSPLHNATPKSLLEQQVEIVVSFTGIDETLSQSIHARHSYGGEEILFGARFEDVFSQLPNGERTLDLSKFHETVPLTEPSDQADKKRISLS
jgi:inward rectifier potassium channel